MARRPGMTKQDTQESVWELAVQRMVEVYNRYDLVVIGFSGGKDSTVLLHAALEAAELTGNLPVKVHHFDEEANTPETIEYVRRVYNRDDVDLDWWCLPIQHVNACSRSQVHWHPWNPDEEDLWVFPLPEEALTMADLPQGTPWCTHTEMIQHIYPASLGLTIANCVGIRAAESLRRFRSVTSRSAEQDNWISQDGYAKHLFTCKPIYDWSTADVWTAPAKFGWDYNRTYDLLQMMGESRHNQRVAPPYGEQPMQRLWQYAQAWPDLWEKMICRVDGAATAGRYSRSPLYAFGDSAKPDDMTWKEAIRCAIERWPPHVQKLLATRCKACLRLHRRQSGNQPMPEVKHHPLTGMSWKWLYGICVRGDFKGRTAPKFPQEKKP